jgi:hypothetical protein
MRINPKKENFLRFYAEECCNISNACVRTPISRTTYGQWRRNDPWFKQQCEDVEASFDDKVESKLKDRIASGDWPCIKYWLENRLSDRWQPKEASLNLGGSVGVSGQIAVNIVKNIVGTKAAE